MSAGTRLRDTRAGRALSRPHNWIQLAKFTAVGASGYVVNLVVYTLLLKAAGLHYLGAASFRCSRSRRTWSCCACSSRSASARSSRRRSRSCSSRRSTSSATSSGRSEANVTAMRRVIVPVACVLFLVASAAAHGAASPTNPVYDDKGRLVETPLAPAQAPAQRTQEQVTKRFLAVDKVHDWLERYPVKGRTTSADYSSQFRWWTVHVWFPEAGEIARGRVDDASGFVTESWTGPQVAWTMARGSPGAFGGKKINSYKIWLAFCVVFLLGL